MKAKVLILATIALLLAAGALAYVGATRIAEANRESDKELFVFQVIPDRTFTYAGRPVTIEDWADGQGNEGVEIRFGDQSLRLRAPVPPGHEQLPGLVRHEQWLRVLRFAPRRGITMEELLRRIDAGEVRDRLAVVVVSPRPGSDPQRWALVWHRDATFDIYEFLPDGGLTHERFEYPESDRSLARRQAAARSRGEAIPQRSSTELVEGTWQYHAALLALPKGREPTPRFIADGWEAAGWPLPAAMAATALACLTLIAGLGEIAKARRQRSPWPRSAEQRVDG